MAELCSRIIFFRIKSVDQYCFLFQDKAETNASSQKLLENKFAKHVCFQTCYFLFEASLVTAKLLNFFYTHFLAYLIIANGINSQVETYQH